MTITDPGQHAEKLDRGSNIRLILGQSPRNQVKEKHYALTEPGCLAFQILS